MEVFRSNYVELLSPVGVAKDTIHCEGASYS
jgi:hypothetical protein